MFLKAKLLLLKAESEIVYRGSSERIEIHYSNPVMNKVIT